MELRVNWAPERLLTFEEVLARPGYYFNAMSGDLYRHEQHPAATERNAPAIAKAHAEGRAHVEPAIWLFVTDDLDLNEGEVRALLRDAFNVRMEAPGRLASRVKRRP